MRESDQQLRLAVLHSQCRSLKRRAEAADRRRRRRNLAIQVGEFLLAFAFVIALIALAAELAGGR